MHVCAGSFGCGQGRSEPQGWHDGWAGAHLDNAAIVLCHNPLHRAARAVVLVTGCRNSQAGARVARVRNPRPYPQAHVAKELLADSGILVLPLDHHVDARVPVEAVVSQVMRAADEPAVLELEAADENTSTVEAPDEPPGPELSKQVDLSMLNEHPSIIPKAAITSASNQVLIGY